MRKYISMLLLAAALTASAGCKAAESGSDITTEAMPTVEASAEVTAAVSAEDTASAATTTAAVTEEAPEEDIPTLTAGIWEAYFNGIPDGYYIIYADTMGGSTISFDTGTGVPFAYGFTEEGIAFSAGAVDSLIYYAAESLSENEAVFTREDGTVLTLKHRSEGGVEELPFFYSNLEIEELAVSYYERTYGATPPSAASHTEADGSVTVQLYESLSDHNATWAWYSVNRFTGEAEDVVMCKPIENFTE